MPQIEISRIDMALLRAEVESLAALLPSVADRVMFTADPDSPRRVLEMILHKHFRRERSRAFREATAAALHGRDRNRRYR